MCGIKHKGVFERSSIERGEVERCIAGLRPRPLSASFRRHSTYRACSNKFRASASGSAWPTALTVVLTSGESVIIPVNTRSNMHWIVRTALAWLD